MPYRATIELMEAEAKNISIRTSYNISGMSFSPKEIGQEIQNTFPALQLPMSRITGSQLLKAGRKVSMTKLRNRDWKWILNIISVR